MCVGVCVGVCHFDLGFKKSSTIHKSSFCEIEYKPSMQIAACNRQTESNWQSNEIILCVVFIFFLSRLTVFIHSVAVFCSVLSNKCEFYIYPCYWLVRFKALHRKWFGCDWLRFFFLSMLLFCHRSIVEKMRSVFSNCPP